MRAFIILTLTSAVFATSFDTGFKKIDDSFHYGFQHGQSPVFFKNSDPFSGPRVISYAADNKGFHAQIKSDEGTFIPKDPSEITIKNARLVEVAPIKYTVKHSPAVHYYAGFPFIDSSKTEEVKKIENVGESPKISFYSGGFPSTIHDKINHPKPVFFSSGFPTMKKFDEPSKMIHYSPGFSFGPQIPFKDDPKIAKVQFYSAGGATPVVVHQDKVEDHKILDFAHTAPVHKGDHEIKKVEEKVHDVKVAPVFKFSEHQMIPGHHAMKPDVHFYSSGVPVVHEIKEVVEDKVSIPIKVVDKVDEHTVKKEPVITYSSGTPSFHSKPHEMFIKVPIHSSGWAVKPIEVKPVEVIPYSGGWFQKPTDFSIKKFEEKIDPSPIHYSSGWPFTFTSSFEHKPQPTFGGSNWFKWM